MRGWVAAAWMVSQAAWGAPAPQLAAPGFVGVGVEPSRLAFYTQHVAQQLGFHGVRVITSEEIGQVLGLERQKQLLGCGDNSTECMTELANALGVTGLLLGQVAKIGDAFQVDLKIIAARDARPLAAYSFRVNQEKELLGQLDLSAASLAEGFAQKMGLKTGSTERPGSVASRAWIPVVAGAVVAVLGGVSFAMAASKDSQLKTGPFTTQADAQSVASQGSMFQTLGAIGLGVGGAGVLGGGLMFAFEQPSAQAGVASSRTVSVGWVGVWP